MRSESSNLDWEEGWLQVPLSTWQGTLALLQPAVGPGPPDPAPTLSPPRSPVMLSRL